MTVKPNIYLDTSVINFLFATDAPELMSATTDFFDNFINKGIYNAFVSDIVIDEINNTKNESKRLQLLEVINEYELDFTDLSNLAEMNRLADLYQLHGIIPVNKRADAM